MTNFVVICVALGIPSIMWSDIINNYQRLYPGATVSFIASFRRIFTFNLGSNYYPNEYQHLTSSPLSSSLSHWCPCSCNGLRIDYIRLTFVLFVCSYSINELVVIASFMQYFFQNRNVSDFVDHSALYRVGNTKEKKIQYHHNIFNTDLLSLALTYTLPTLFIIMLMFGSVCCRYLRISSPSLYSSSRGIACSVASVCR